MIRTVAQTGSTNADLAARLAAGDVVPEGDWLVADRQTAGRGRQGRPWSDGAGNFMGSTVVHPGPGDPPVPTLALVAGLGVAALLQDFRPRLAVALVTALALAISQRLWWRSAPSSIVSLSRHSYALFLVHFPVCLVVNALLVRFDPDDGLSHLLGILLAWTLSNLAAITFYRHVEQPLMRGLALRPACTVAR